MFALRSTQCSSSSTVCTYITPKRRGYAISVKSPKPLPGKKMPRVFRDKKAFQYNWYTKILDGSKTGPLLFLHHKSFSANRLAQLRRDIIVASNRMAPSLASAAIPATPLPTTQQPTLTAIRTNIFGAALREFPDVDLETADKMFEGTSGNFAVLALPSLHPPQLNAILRALERGVPARPPKSAEELRKEQEEKNADPVTPGRRMKRVRAILHPELKLVGALVEGRMLMPGGVKDVSKLPTFDTLRAQIVGLLSAPGMQLAGVLSQASGGKLARTLEGFEKGLEEGGSSPTPPS